MKIKMEINRSMNQLKKMVGIFAGLALLMSFSSFTSSSNNADAIVGVWKTGEGTAMVRIYKNGDKYQGKIVWLKEPNDPETGKPKVDKNHPDEAVRSRPILGLINVWGFVHKGENVWDEGNIYDPKNGNTYSCTIKMDNPNALEVRGYIGVSLIGRTDVWTRQVAK
ncbi:MAG: DUF2147 domain-containing protein [Sediminibacterium sp.]